MTEPTHGAGRSGGGRSALAAPERREDETMQSTSVPFFRPSITSAEIDEVVDTLLSGWLTTGPKTKRFESEFAAAVGARHAIAVNSCTAALRAQTADEQNCKATDKAASSADRPGERDCDSGSERTAKALRDLVPCSLSTYRIAADTRGEMGKDR